MGRPHAYAAVSSGDDSVCSMPCHDGGRTHCAPTRSIGTNLPPAQSPRDRDGELPLLILRSWVQSITTMNCLTDEVALTDTLELLPADIAWDRYLLDSGRYNWLWFLCCLGIVMNNLLQSYGIDGHSLLG
jgi:hypothetical protein